jgi:hypothetical protein
VPAAAVIPAPIAYIKVVAVKKLVVELLQSAARCTFRGGSVFASAFWRLLQILNCVCGCRWRFYFEKIRVFQAGLCLEYCSME